MQKRFVYADCAATTPVEQPVLDVLTRTAAESWGNPSSLYSVGREAKKIITASREKIASLLGCNANEIYFTSGGTESDNWAIKGVAYANIKKGKHIITTAFEHHAALHTLQSLEKEGWEVTYLDVHENGVIRIDELEAAIRPDTVLISIMYVNNEIGTIQPVKEAASIAKKHGVLFFTDAVQAVGHIELNMKDLGVDMLAFSGHKFGSPKGIGGIYIRNGVRLKNLVEGGGQERSRRSGTENTPYIAALAAALEYSLSLKSEHERIRSMRDRLIDELLKMPSTRLNGDRENRIYSNLNISFEFIEGESLILLLDMAGICASTGSACSTASLDPSHVLLAIGLKHEVAHGSLRLSLNHLNTDEDVDYLLEQIPKAVNRLREMSPIWHAPQQ